MIDGRAETIVQRQLISAVQNSRYVVAQRRHVDRLLASNHRPPASSHAAGLPQNLKSGIETLSGLSMDDVTVHYNSPKPESVGALAYAQGRKIYLAPGQERHLPHEAWHVVQQAQGRVQPTLALKVALPVNDDQKLEHEADRMGEKAVQTGGHGDCRPGLAPAAKPAGVPAGGTMPTIQRRIILVGPGDQRADVRALGADGMKYALDHEANWFKSEIKPHLHSRTALTYFHGFLTNNSGDYDLAADVGADPTTLNYQQINDGIIRAFNIHFMQKRMKNASRGIGRYKTLSRDGFPSLIKKAFDKADIISITGLISKQIHLRHFVMGSWFRALPDVIAKADLSAPDRVDLGKRIAALIPRLGPYSGMPLAAASGQLDADSEAMAMLLHDLEPNLNAGEGAENSLIGFMSHGFTELAIDIKKEQTSVNRDDIPQLFQCALDTVGLVAKEARDQWVSDFGPLDVFESMLQQEVGDTDPAPPDEMAKVLHQFAYQLGMDFMKRNEGLSLELQKEKINVIARVQSLLVGVGEKLYAILVKGQSKASAIDATDLVKLVNDIELLATGLETTFPRKK